MTINYDWLVAQIPLFLNRTDLTDEIPNFIELALQKIIRESAKSIGFEVYLTDTIASGTYLIQKPDDWRKTISFSLGTVPASVTDAPAVSIDPVIVAGLTPLFYRTFETMRLYWPFGATTGVPLYYTDYATSAPVTVTVGDVSTTTIVRTDSILIAPAANTGYTYVWSYVQMPTSLSSTQQTNWLTQFAPDALFYGALLQACPYIQDEAKEATWNKAYDRALMTLNGLNSDPVDRSSNINT